jgi:hypothetical protein
VSSRTYGAEFDDSSCKNCLFRVDSLHSIRSRLKPDDGLILRDGGVISGVPIFDPGEDSGTTWCCEKYLRLRASPRSPMLPANLGERTCCLYAFSPIPSTESNSGIPSQIASIPAPSPQTKSAYRGCLRKACPNLDYLCFAIFAPRKYPNLTRDVFKRTKVTCDPKNENVPTTLF